MATKLDKPLIRETGLKREDRDVFVVMVPSESGGSLLFKEKGKHGQGAEVSLAKVMALALGEAVEIPKQASKTVERKEHSGDIDLVDLAILEARLMIHTDPILTEAAQEKFFDIIREMREEAREEAGLPPLASGTKRRQYQERE